MACENVPVLMPCQLLVSPHFVWGYAKNFKLLKEKTNLTYSLSLLKMIFVVKLGKVKSNKIWNFLNARSIENRGKWELVHRGYFLEIYPDAWINWRKLYSTTNSELINVTDWCKANDLSLDVFRTVYILFHKPRKEPYDDDRTLMTVAFIILVISYFISWWQL